MKGLCTGLSVLSIGLLAACGGGDDDAVPVPTPPTPVHTPGLWVGSTSMGFDIQVLITEDGELWGVYNNPGSLSAGLIHGESEVVDDTLTATGRDFYVDGSVTPGQIEATVVSETSMTGKVTGTSHPVTFNLVFDGRYYQRALFGSVEGSWDVVEAGAGVGSFEVSRFGAFSGHSLAASGARCHYAGNLVPHAQFNYYTVSLTFANERACELPGQKVEGITLISGSDSEAVMSIALLSADGWQGGAALAVPTPETPVPAPTDPAPPPVAPVVPAS